MSVNQYKLQVSNLCLSKGEFVEVQGHAFHRHSTSTTTATTHTAFAKTSYRPLRQLSEEKLQLSLKPGKRNIAPNIKCEKSA
jgi:hypothetical protein